MNGLLSIVCLDSYFVMNFIAKSFSDLQYFILVLFSSAVDFFNQVNILFGTLTEFCTPSTCPTMSAGPKYASV